MKVINDVQKLQEIENTLNAGFEIAEGGHKKFQKSVASIDFNFYDDVTVAKLYNYIMKLKEASTENLEHEPSVYICQKSTFSRLKSFLDVRRLENVYTHQIVFFEYGCRELELKQLYIIPDDGFLSNMEYITNGHTKSEIILSSKEQNKYKQMQHLKAKHWQELFKKKSLENIIQYYKILPNQSETFKINFTCSVSLGEDNNFNHKAGIVVTYEDILHVEPNMLGRTSGDMYRYKLLKIRQCFITNNIPIFLDYSNLLYEYNPKLSQDFLGSNGGGFFDPYYNGINTLCCTLFNPIMSNSVYNILTRDIPAAFMLYFPVTNEDEGKYEGYYQGQREIPIPKGEFTND